MRVATPGSALLFPSLCVPTARLTISEIRHQPARTRFAKMPRRTHTRVDTIAKEGRDNHKHRTQ